MASEKRSALRTTRWRARHVLPKGLHTATSHGRTGNSFRANDVGISVGLTQGVASATPRACSPVSHAHTNNDSQASASDLGQRYCDTTNYAVAVGLDYTMEKTRSALAAVGVTEVSARAVQLADAAVAASGVVSYTRAAVDATGRAIEASGALSAVSRVTEASAEALSASMDATVHVVDRAVDLTVTSTRKAVEYSARAAEVLPGAVDLARHVRGAGAQRLLEGLHLPRPNPLVSNPDAHAYAHTPCAV